MGGIHRLLVRWLLCGVASMRGGMRKIETGRCARELGISSCGCSVVFSCHGVGENAGVVSVEDSNGNSLHPMQPDRTFKRGAVPRLFTRHQPHHLGISPQISSDMEDKTGMGGDRSDVPFN